MEEAFGEGEATLDGDRLTFELWNYHGDEYAFECERRRRSSPYPVEQLHKVPLAFVLGTEQLQILVKLLLAAQPLHQSAHLEEQLVSLLVSRVVRAFY